MKGIPRDALSAVCVLALLFTLVIPTGGQTASGPAKPHRTLPAEIENPIGLANFFRALRSIKSGQRREPVRVMHFGDSHTAADILTGEIRRRFQTEFGDGGPGFIVPRNPMTTRRRGVVSGATAGWIIEGIGGRVPADRILGPAGISLSTTAMNERAWLETSANHFEIYYVRQPGGGRIDISIDGNSVLDRPLSLNSRTPQLDHYVYDVATDEPHHLEIRTVGAGKVRIAGIVAEQFDSGVSYDQLGINGARAARILSWNSQALAAALAERQPDLIILAYGTNESADADWTAVSYQRTLAAILSQLKLATPRASILVYGPPDRADSPLPAARLPALVNAERRAALAAGAAFWSSYDAMGGEDSMDAWVRRGLGQSDHVHLTSAGYVRIADQFYQALMRAYAKRS